MIQLKTRSKATTPQPQQGKLPNGRAAAAILAAGISCLTLGLLTILVATFKSLGQVLQFYPPAGEVSGISTLTVAAWLISWFVLFRLWKNKQVDFTQVFVVTLILIVLGLVGTVPLSW